MNRRLRILTDTLRKNKSAIILFAAMTLLGGTIFLLYDIMTEAFLYAELLLAVLLLLLVGIDLMRETKRAAERERNICSLVDAGYEKAENGCLADEDYSQMIALLEAQAQKLRTDFAFRKQEDEDYYTAWVHQIKTPIAVMKLELSEDTEKNRALLSELFRIEQYVEMVLDYGRLESESNDLVIREYELDEIIREALRKFAPQFVLRKLKLNYEPAQGRVVTDRKWLLFILEQLISNAIKYTPCGEITVAVQGNTIRISDTGIGIAPEDLPRIFEKGYTGVNGRLGQKSSGLGLFLTRKAVRLIAADIRCESTVGRGSAFTLTLPDKS